MARDEYSSLGMFSESSELAAMKGCEGVVEAKGEGWALEGGGKRAGSEVRRVEVEETDDDWECAARRGFLPPATGYGWMRDDAPDMWDLYKNKLIVSITGPPANG